LKTVTSCRVINFRDSDALGSSVLECRVYAKRKIHSDDFIGGVQETVESLLAEGASGGLYLLILALFSKISTPLAITRELYEHDAQGNQNKTQIIIEFTIVAISKASDATGLDMKEAVAQGKAAIDQMKRAPLPVGQIQGAVDSSPTVIGNIKSMSNTWGPLLQKIKLFTELVDGIAKV
jgi:hypothetical protein